MDWRNSYMIMMQLDELHGPVGINKGCLQKAHPQTHHKNPTYFPHITVKAARKYIDSPNSGWESAQDLRKFIASEEAEIDSHFTT